MDLSFYMSDNWRGLKYEDEQRLLSLLNRLWLEEDPQTEDSELQQTLVVFLKIIQGNAKTQVLAGFPEAI